MTNIQDRYHAIYAESRGEEYPYFDEEGPGHWTRERFDYIMRSREEALNFARRIWADYTWVNA